MFSKCPLATLHVLKPYLINNTNQFHTNLNMKKMILLCNPNITYDFTHLFIWINIKNECLWHWKDLKETSVLCPNFNKTLKKTWSSDFFHGHSNLLHKISHKGIDYWIYPLNWVKQIRERLIVARSDLQNLFDENLNRDTWKDRNTYKRSVLCGQPVYTLPVKLASPGKDTWSRSHRAKCSGHCHQRHT